MKNGQDEHSLNIALDAISAEIPKIREGVIPISVTRILTIM